MLLPLRSLWLGFTFTKINVSNHHPVPPRERPFSEIIFLLTLVKQKAGFGRSPNPNNLWPRDSLPPVENPGLGTRTEAIYIWLCPISSPPHAHQPVHLWSASSLWSSGSVPSHLHYMTWGPAVSLRPGVLTPGIPGLSSAWMSKIGYVTPYPKWRLPWWFSGKEAACQCRRCRFYPCVGKIPWRRKWQPAPVFLPREFHGQRSLAGFSPWGFEELDMI